MLIKNPPRVRFGNKLEVEKNWAPSFSCTQTGIYVLKKMSSFDLFVLPEPHLKKRK